MVSRKYKYHNINLLYNFFDNKENKLYLFVHLNNISMFENNLLQHYCNEKRIESLSVKSSLIRKIVTNKILLSVFSGPTKIYAFSDLTILLNLFNTIYIKNKLLPLTIFWNKKFYSYNFFLENLVAQSKKLSFALDEKKIKTRFLTNFSVTNLNIVNILSFKNFLKFLNVLKNIKINK